MEEDDDMFAIPSQPTGTNNSQPRQLYQVVNVQANAASKSQYANAQDMVEAAAKSRIGKQDAANHRRSELYDERDKDDFEDDVDNVLDVTAMGTEVSATGGRRTSESRRRQDELREVLDGEHIAPLSMRDEMKRGEVNAYGEIRHKKRKRRGEEEQEKPDELAMPSVDANGNAVARKKHKRKEHMPTGDSSSDESDESEDDGMEDEDEIEALEAEDAWLASVSKNGEIVAYSSSKHEEPSRPVHAYLQSTKVALETLQDLMKNAPANLTVTQLIKRLAPSSSSTNRSKKAKASDSATPSNSTEDNEAQQDADERKETFEKLVNLASHLLEIGFSRVYEFKLEDVVAKLKPKTSKKESEIPESDEAEIPQAEDGSFWQYKWTLEATEIFGPFDVESMKSWAPSFQQFPGMVVRGGSSPAKVAKLAPDERWIAFEPVLWS